MRWTSRTSSWAVSIVRQRARSMHRGRCGFPWLNFEGSPCSAQAVIRGNSVDAAPVVRDDVAVAADGSSRGRWSGGRSDVAVDRLRFARPTRLPGRRREPSRCCSPGGRSSPPAWCSGRRGRATTSGRCSSRPAPPGSSPSGTTRPSGRSAVFTIGLVFRRPARRSSSIVDLRPPVRPDGRLAGAGGRGCPCHRNGDPARRAWRRRRPTHERQAAETAPPISCSSTPTRVGLADFAQAGIRVGFVASVGVIGIAGWRLLRSSPAKRRVVAPTMLAGRALLRRRGLDVRGEPRPVRSSAAARWSGGCGSSRPAPSCSSPRPWCGAGCATSAPASRLSTSSSSSARRRPLAGFVTPCRSRLADPDLEVGYAIGDGRWATVSGNDVSLPAGWRRPELSRRSFATASRWR